MYRLCANFLCTFLFEVRENHNEESSSAIIHVSNANGYALIVEILDELEEISNELEKILYELEEIANVIGNPIISLRCPNRVRGNCKWFPLTRMRLELDGFINIKISYINITEVEDFCLTLN